MDVCCSTGISESRTFRGAILHQPNRFGLSSGLAAAFGGKLGNDLGEWDVVMEDQCVNRGSMR